MNSPAALNIWEHVNVLLPKEIKNVQFPNVKTNLSYLRFSDCAQNDGEIAAAGIGLKNGENRALRWEQDLNERY